MVAICQQFSDYLFSDFQGYSQENLGDHLANRNNPAKCQIWSVRSGLNCELALTLSLAPNPLLPRICKGIIRIVECAIRGPLLLNLISSSTPRTTRRPFSPLLTYMLLEMCALSLLLFGPSAVQAASSSYINAAFKQALGQSERYPKKNNGCSVPKAHHTLCAGVVEARTRPPEG